MKEDKKLRELQPELYPDRRIKFTVDNMGSKHSLALRPWVLVLVAALLLTGLALLAIFAGRGPGAADAELLAKLEKENKFLQEKVGGYEAELDSVMATLDTLNINVPSDTLSYPSYSEEPFGPENKLQVHPGLEKKLIGIEVKLANIKQRLGFALEESRGDFKLPFGFDRHGDGIPSIQPTFGEIVSGWGTRRHPVLGGYRFHQGIDIANKIGTPVYATADGVVERAQTENGWGKVININHTDGYRTLYAHLHSIKVRVGDVVSKGQIIGLMGSTGMSTGPHLHYGVYRDDKSVDPVYYLNRLDTSTYASNGR
ncbi:MAG: M23 family metallopeptidase [Candidatus Cloacimonetes bacterium]|jgi:murein DD-endopeptidase MepM/ murein hydrolase activator NlpD|nr:M23 family metallopeptidase [Candidatus Cloacimonadota bacterium]MDY0367531.1 M23 family metallopeptidase [Candidatus Syntrophosphaera sp.]